MPVGQFDYIIAVIVVVFRYFTDWIWFDQFSGVVVYFHFYCLPLRDPHWLDIDWLFMFNINIDLSNWRRRCFRYVCIMHQLIEEKNLFKKYRWVALITHMDAQTHAINIIPFRQIESDMRPCRIIIVSVQSLLDFLVLPSFYGKVSKWTLWILSAKEKKENHMHDSKHNFWLQIIRIFSVFLHSWIRHTSYMRVACLLESKNFVHKLSMH